MKCSGYRDPVSLLFRDENAKTRQRYASAKDRSGRRKLQSTPVSPVTTTITQVTNLADQPSSSLDERGLRFFLDRFTSTSHWITRGRSSVVHPRVEEIIACKATREALEAVGLVALFNVTGEKAYHTAALQKYVASIYVIRRTIQDPANANVEDTTWLLMILSIYEVCTR